MWVVKNEKGEWLCWEFGMPSMDLAFLSKKKVRLEFREKKLAFARAKEWGGKVYRVRKVTATREREMIVAYVRGISVMFPLWVGKPLFDIAGEIEAMNHRKRQ